MSTPPTNPPNCEREPSEEFIIVENPNDSLHSVSAQTYLSLPEV